MGPFERTHDFFGDGSLFVVDASGHMPGHINILVRTDASGKWAYLAGDSFHDRRILTGEKEIGHFHENGQICCMHDDEEQAKKHISRIKLLPDSVSVYISHEPTWRELWKQ